MRSLSWKILGVLWATAVIGGMVVVVRYANAPGAPGKPPADWPARTVLARSSTHGTLVLVVHPHCPCTRATIAELAKLMSAADSKLTTHTLFLKPKGMPEDWEKTDLWTNASNIPGVDVRTDEDGTEAELFGAKVSGQAMLYDAAGRLVFRGGITAARGHQGDNPGGEAILSFVRNGTVPSDTSKVFGCSLTEKAPVTTAQK